jgi:predicted nucleic acid-binding protein
VVDASAVCAMIFLEPEGVAISELLERVNWVAPELLDYEVGNTCLKKIRKNPGLEEELLAAHQGFCRMPLTRVKVDHADVLPLARRHGLSAYDASYLWLARHLKLDLITLDKDLKKALLSEG